MTDHGFTTTFAADRIPAEAFDATGGQLAAARVTPQVRAAAGPVAVITSSRMIDPNGLPIRSPQLMPAVVGPLRHDKENDHGCRWSFCRLCERASRRLL